jgi:hypothetical protein
VKKRRPVFVVQPCAAADVSCASFPLELNVQGAEQRCVYLP